MSHTDTLPDTTERDDKAVGTIIARIASLDDVRADVEANHDDNRWWPTSVTDPRMRMLVAGWSARVSYSMISTYERVVTAANMVGFDELSGMSDDEVVELVRPLGLSAARVGYLRSLNAFFDSHDIALLLHGEQKFAIDTFASHVQHASYKVAQCALLYGRGYHSGIIPVDSGMVTHVAPVLGLGLPSGPSAHEHMRLWLQAALHNDSGFYRKLPEQLGYRITVPDNTLPSWWLHLVLIYFKRRYLNRPHHRLCTERPVCDAVVGCEHAEVPP